MDADTLIAIGFVAIPALLVAFAFFGFIMAARQERKDNDDD